MTDLEITKLCAEAMGIRLYRGNTLTANPADVTFVAESSYDPLHDDAQAMALVKKFYLEIKRPKRSEYWHVWGSNHFGPVLCDDLNRAICECVAKMKLANRTESESERL